jgi:cell division protein ZapA (FtsZ GTPase activity inhibitor)
MAASTKVQVTIRGQRYTFRTDEDDIDLVAVARDVDERMGQIELRMPGIERQSVALLAAIQLASDLARWRRQVGLDLGEIERQLASTEALLESSIAADAVEGE